MKLKTYILDYSFNKSILIGTYYLKKRYHNILTTYVR